MGTLPAGQEYSWGQTGDDVELTIPVKILPLSPCVLPLPSWLKAAPLPCGPPQVDPSWKPRDLEVDLQPKCIRLSHRPTGVVFLQGDLVGKVRTAIAFR